jgi:hypothetical protein
LLRRTPVLADGAREERFLAITHDSKLIRNLIQELLQQLRHFIRPFDHDHMASSLHDMQLRAFDLLVQVLQTIWGRHAI